MAKRSKTANPNTNRKTILTPELIEGITKKITEGMYVTDACATFGIGKDSWYDWMKKAKREPDIYPLCVRFSESIMKAQADCKAYFIEKLKNASVVEWKAAAWYLERRFPKEYGKREQLDISGVDAEADNLKVKTEQDLIDEIKETDSALKELEHDGKPRKK